MTTFSIQALVFWITSSSSSSLFSWEELLQLMGLLLVVSFIMFRVLVVIAFFRAMGVVASRWINRIALLSPVLLLRSIVQADVVVGWWWWWLEINNGIEGGGWKRCLLQSDGRVLVLKRRVVLE